MWNKTRILIFCANLPETFIILRTIQHTYIIINVHRPSHKVIVILTRL